MLDKFKKFIKNQIHSKLKIWNEFDIELLNTKEIENSFQITNYTKVLTYICDVGNRSIRLSKNQSVKFTEIFGKHNTTYKNYEFFNKVWIVSYCDETFNIFTSEKGTTFEIVAKYSDKKEIICLDFLKKIEFLLNENKSVK